jgi:putative membrane protein
MGGMGWWMTLSWLASLVVLVLLIRWLAGTSSAPPSDDPEQILKRRYAKGEIDREEYQRRLEDLRR